MTSLRESIVRSRSGANHSQRSIALGGHVRVWIFVCSLEPVRTYVTRGSNSGFVIYVPSKFPSRGLKCIFHIEDTDAKTIRILHSTSYQGFSKTTPVFYFF